MDNSRLNIHCGLLFLVRVSKAAMQADMDYNMDGSDDWTLLDCENVNVACAESNKHFEIVLTPKKEEDNTDVPSDHNMVMLMETENITASNTLHNEETGSEVFKIRLLK